MSQEFNEEQLKQYKEYQAKERTAIEERLKRKVVMDTELRTIKASAEDIAAKFDEALAGKCHLLIVLAYYGYGTCLEACQILPSCMMHNGCTSASRLVMHVVFSTVLPYVRNGPLLVTQQHAVMVVAKHVSCTGLAQKRLTVLAEIVALEARVLRLACDVEAVLAASDDVERAALKDISSHKEKRAQIVQVPTPQTPSAYSLGWCTSSYCD